MKGFLDQIGVKYLWQKVKSHVAESIAAIESKLSSVYHFKGSVADIESLKALPEEGLEIGDTYNVKSTGMNYGWTGDKENPDYEDGWDSLGGMIDIPTLSTEDIDKILLEE